MRSCTRFVERRWESRWSFQYLFMHRKLESDVCGIDTLQLQHWDLSHMLTFSHIIWPDYLDFIDVRWMPHFTSTFYLSIRHFYPKPCTIEKVGSVKGLAQGSSSELTQLTFAVNRDCSTVIILVSMNECSRSLMLFFVSSCSLANFFYTLQTTEEARLPLKKNSCHANVNLCCNSILVQQSVLANAVCFHWMYWLNEM